jgi:undecaprenyl-diphosphatase
VQLLGADHPARKAVLAFDNACDRACDVCRGNPVVDRVMYAASELGNWSLIWHLIGTAQALRRDRGPMSAVRVSAILGAESALVNGGIKSLFRRKRPHWEAIRPRQLRIPRTSSFPSGHASSGFTAAGVLSEGDRLAPLYYAVAVVVASSRVYVKIHHASDVVAGAALGIVLGRAARRVWPLGGMPGRRGGLGAP